MKAKFLSAHIDATTGKVVALTDKGLYLYKDLLDEKKTAWLMSQLCKADEINLTHWHLEWELNKLGS